MTGGTTPEHPEEHSERAPADERSQRVGFARPSSHFSPASISRVLLIANPASRVGRLRYPLAVEAFRRAKVQCEAVLTERVGHGAEIAAERAASFDAVFTLGGDGTAMEVVGCLSGSGLPVGILPGGTGNLIARTLGIPLDVRRAVPALLGGRVAQVDLGRLDAAHGGRRFAFAAGVGIDAAMIERTPSALKRRIGVLAYVIAAAGAVMRRDEFRVRVIADGHADERAASAVMVANFGAVLNDLLTLGPGIAHDDGHLDVCVFSPTTFLDAVRVVWRMLRKDFTTDRCMLYVPGRQIRVEIDPPHHFQADGELLGETPFEVTVEPLAARMLVPERRRRPR
ncbi:MAG TPA: diacylglycerol kinase family protein [Gemmatimonadaceae bacterium]|nr:diacylglycerol kinase family protein [Gemmatimonadaceae bacterium]